MTLQRVWFMAALLAVISLGGVREATAQARSTFTGTITDSAGMKLSGVTVSAESGSVPDRPRETLTNARGVYRLSDLPPGTYELTATRPSFQTVKRAELRLPVGTTLTVDLTLRAAGTPETVTIGARSPVVDVTTAASITQFGLEELENFPITTADGLLQLAPGVARGAAFGAAGDANQRMVDGSPTVFTHGGGNAGVDVHPYWMDQAQIVTVGATADLGDFSGVVTNVTLRSGTNRLSGLLEYRTTRPQWVADNTSALPEALRSTFRPQEILTNWTTNLQAGGPIVPDRVFFFSGFQYIRTETLQAGTIGNVPQQVHSPNFLARVNGVISQNVRADGFVQHQRFHSEGMLTRNQLPEAAGDNNTLVSSWNGRLIWIVNTRTLVEVRDNGLDFQNVNLPGARRAGPSPHFDSVTQIQSGNAGGFSDTLASHVLTGASVRHFLTDFTKRTHEIEGGVEYDHMKSRLVSGIPGGRSYMDAGGAPNQVTLWDGDAIESSGARTTFYAQDVWRATDRLTIHPGVRLAFNRGSVPDKGLVFKTNPVSPRIGVAWDVARDHRTVVRAGFGRLHDGLYPTVFDFLNSSGLNPRITARVLGPDNFEVLNRSATATLALDDGVAHAYVDQYLAGIEREMFPSVSVRGQYIRRNFSDIWAFIDTGSRYAPVQRRDPGPDGQLNTPDDGVLLDVFNLLNPNQSLPVLTNPDGAFRRHDAVQLVADKRWSRNWQLLAAYTWSRSRGTVNIAGGEKRAAGADTGRAGVGSPVGGVFFNPNRFINAEGPSGPDFSHLVNIQGTYLLPAWGGVKLSGGYRYSSGGAWGRTAMITGLAQGNQPVRIEPRGTRRLDATSQLDVRLEKLFPLGGAGRSASVYVDVFNVTNQGVATTVQEGSGAAFGQPGGAGWTTARTAQIAGRIKF